MSARRLLAEGEALWDRSPALRAAASEAVSPGFSAAVRWMASAQRALRGDASSERESASGAQVAWSKYALSTLGAAVAASLARACGAPWLAAAPIGVLGFYLVEVQFVFAVPLALDGARRPLGESRAMLRRCGGTIAGLRVVLPIATHMLTGPMRFDALRSWCAGCIAVLRWYDEVKEDAR